MNPFQFHNPTRVRFGDGVVDDVGKECHAIGAKALIVLGQGSARRSGLLDRVLARMGEAGMECLLHEGVRPNPVLSHVEEGIVRARQFGADLVLAVGGGSVLDSAKAICAGALHVGDVWDFFCGKATVKAALPLVTILTLAATGSEMNGGGVVTREATQEKFPFSSPHCFPRLSLLEPGLTLSLPWQQTANGLSDAFAHLMEPWCNTTIRRPLVQLELKEGLFRCLLDCGARLKRNPQDLEARGEFMWTATLALNGVSSAGLAPAIWPVHMIEHSLSALTDIAHGAGLSALFPGWLRWRLRQPDEIHFAYRLARLGERVFGLQPSGDEQADAAATIEAITIWYHEIGSPASLTEAEIDPALLGPITANAEATARLWGLKDYTTNSITDILKEAT